MSDPHPIILSFRESQQRKIDAYIEFLNPIVRRCGHSDFEIKRESVELEHLGFCAMECVEIGEEREFLLGWLALFGEIMVREHGCTWAECIAGSRREYVLCHPSFPTPVILGCLHEYACARQKDLIELDEIFLSEAGNAEWKSGVGWMTDSINVLDDAYESLTTRINAYRNRNTQQFELALWRSPRPFSLVIDGFPDKSARLGFA